MPPLNLVVALAIAIGLAGIVVPVLPGALLVLAAITVWAWMVGTPTAWVVFAIAVTFLAVGQVVKYALPGKRLKTSGVPKTSLLIGAVLGVVGFFVIPVVGLLIGFVVGVYLAEHRRVGPRDAWPATVATVKAVGLSILIELVSALAAAITWAVGAWLFV